MAHKKAENVLVVPQREDFNSPQVNFFQDFLVNSAQQKIPLSNTISLWDFLPKYSISQVEQNKIRTKEGRLPLLRRNVAFQGFEYTIFISPALLADENGRDYYPSANESLVEDALRKIATLQNQCFFNPLESHCGVIFSLHQLRVELKKHGHTRSYQEVMKSLQILAGSGIEIRTQHGKGVSIEKFMSLTGFSSEARLGNQNSNWVAYFHPLVYRAMNAIDYRQFNYQQMMSLKTHLARWLYKRLAHYYTNASLTTPITLSLTGIQNESGMLVRSRTNHAVSELEAIFQNFQEVHVFASFERIKRICGAKNRIIDIVYRATPHPNFIKTVKAANKRQSDTKGKAYLSLQ
ncbi:MAG: hypothetical protein KGZ88_01745 [Methylomicrobium sp.]|nr:hypothetical protein [Methylomicrobium sp.]PPD24117.1 MAG: hypothetical protein CTY24_01985 [Methylobacter sp.]